MAAYTNPIPPGLRLSHDLNDALTTWSTSQRTVIGLAADFADSGEWMATGAVSAAHWIAGVADIEVCTAREWIRVGRRLRVLLLIADLFEADELSYSKVRALSRVATPDNERQLAAIAVDVPAGALPRAIAAWLNRTGDDAALERHQREQRSVTWRTEPDGMVTFTARLPPLDAGVLISRLTAQVMSTRPSGTPIEQWPRLNASAKRRHPSTRQKRVVTERDRACVDCGATTLLEYDHVPDFAHTGHTLVDELQLRCAPCHQRRHDQAAVA